MELLQELVRNIVVIVIIGALIDMMMPSGKLQRYLKMVVGLFIISAILNPVLKITRNPDLGNVINIEKSGGKEEGLAALMEKGQKINEKNNQKGLREYEKRVEQQITALVELDKEVKVLQVSVFVNKDNSSKNFGQVKEVNILAAKAKADSTFKDSIVSPVDINIKTSDQNEKDKNEPVSPSAREKIIKTLTSFYGISPEQVNVQNP